MPSVLHSPSINPKLMRGSLLFCIVFVAMSFATIAQPVKTHGKLRVEGVNLVDEKGIPVVLSGVSFGWHTFHPRFYTAGAVSWLHKDWGSTVVRAAIGVEPKGGYLEKPEWSKEKAKTVINAAIKEGIYVIIDWHSHNIKLNEAKEFFGEMAREYGKYPNVIYEIFNEPDQESWADVKAYANEVIATIRAIDPDNVILVGNPHWDQDVHIVADDPIKNVTNIMYTLHFYAATHKQQLRDRGDYALSKKLPIFISESAGMEASGNGALNDEEWQKWINWAEERKISWITWSVSDKDETCSVLLPSASSDGKWEEKDLKESGIKTRAFLRKFEKKK
jgi:endoglucanase